MSIRMLVIVSITIVNLIIIIFSIFTGTQFASQNIDEAQEADMQIVAEIADRYISNEIELLFLRASDTAKNLMMTDEKEWETILDTLHHTYPYFIGTAVFDVQQGRIATAGNKPAPEDALETTHIADAFDGKKQLGSLYFYDKTSIPDPSDTTVNANSDPGDVVFYMAVPLPGTQDKLLAITIPGMFFHELLMPFVIWETGHVYILDPNGTIVSNPRPHWVYQRLNIPQMAIADPGFKSLANTAASMAQGETDIGYYTVYDVLRVCAYMPITGSQDGWSLGTVAPIPESPFRNLSTALLIAGSMGLTLGIIAAIIASGIIKKPFEQVKALQEESELNSKYKSQFLANMSHEMRTPLTSVIGLTELTLRTVQLDDETHSNLVKVYRAGETLLGLINDILDISKIEANRFELNNGKYDLPSIINDTITQSLLYVGEKPVELVLDITPDLPRQLHGDELRIKQVLNNLLSNAFKFTKEGTVELKIRCEKDSDSVWMTASIKDTGIGIKPKDFEKLFTLYANMDKENKTHDSTRRIEGTGLGLSICKRICEMMDGTITVESEYGKGSTFTAKIRQQFVDDETIGADVVESLKGFHYSIDKFRNADSSRINLSYARVLVVDDNTANLDVAKGLMSLYGMTVDCVTGGQQAIDVIADETVKYDAVFMDHMMPEIDGIEATHRIRKIDSDYARSIPIIALTANAVIGNEEMFLSEGFQAFLAKPIELTRLDAVLRRWVRDKDEEAKLSEAFIDIGAAPENGERTFTADIQGLDVEKGLGHFIKEDVYIDVLRSFAKNTRPLLESINTVDLSNLGEYAIVVHGIKGSSRGIYAEEIGNKAEALEFASKDGNSDFVSKHHDEFIEKATRLIDDIEKALGELPEAEKPVKDTPDKELLKKLLDACKQYDIDSADEIIAELCRYTYTSDDGLAEWLRESLEQGKFKAIIEKLAEET